MKARLKRLIVSAGLIKPAKRVYRSIILIKHSHSRLTKPTTSTDTSPSKEALFNIEIDAAFAL